MKETLKSLREEAKHLGLRGYSKMSKAELQSALTLKTVYRHDRRAIRHLGGVDSMANYSESGWETVGRGRFKRSRPTSWCVPAFRLGGITPLTSEEAEEKRQSYVKAGRKALATTQLRDDEAAMRVGLMPGSRLGRAIRQGEIDPLFAEFIAWRNQYRHEHTDYDDLPRDEWQTKDMRREMASSTHPSFTVWEEYLEFWDWSGNPVAEHLAGILARPQNAHPVWFAEAVFACRWAGNLDSLKSYSDVVDTISKWRVYRSD